MKQFALRIIRVLIFLLATLLFLPVCILMLFYWLFTGADPFYTIIAEAIHIGIYSENPIEDFKYLL